MQAIASNDAAPIATGVPGLDDILAGGYASNRAHLIEGRPGSGKTTLGLQFLLDGVRQGERCLYITLSESKRELLSVAERHGWSLDGLEIYELVPPELSLDPKQQQSLVYTSDLELGETVQMALAEVERVKPVPGGLRQPLRDPAALAGVAALPAPGPRAQELLPAPQCDRADARRSHVRSRTTSTCTASATRSSVSSNLLPLTGRSGGGFGSSRCEACTSGAATMTS